jgi:lipoprotein-releasing system permease protein
MSLPREGARPRRGAFVALRTIVFIALRQLWSRKLLNGIAVGGVALGVLVLIALSGLVYGLRNKFLQTMLRISPHTTIHDTELHPEASLLSLYTGTFIAAKISHAVPSDRQGHIKRPHEVLRALLAMSGVEAAAPSLSGSVLLEFGGRSKSIEVRGVEIDEQEKVTPLRPFLLAGELRAQLFEADGVAVGSGVATALGLHLGDIVHAAAPSGRPLVLRVIAIYETGMAPIDKSRAYAFLRNVQTLLGRPDAVGQIEVRLLDPDSAEWMTERFERVFGYDAESWQEQNASFLAVFSQQDMVTSMVIAAILLVGGFGILAIQIMIVMEKTRDIAILRSTGFRRADILRIFLLQGTIIALVGGAFGCVMGKLALLQLSTMKATSPLVKTDKFLIADDPRFYIQGVVFALLVGLVASFIPAWRAARIEPVDVLRGQIG